MEQPITNHEAPVQTGKSSDPLKMWVMILGILFLVAAGLAVWQFLQVGNVNSRVTELEANAAQLLADKNSLKSQLDLLGGSDATGTDASAQTSIDTTKILAAVDAYVRAPVGAKGSFEYTVKDNDGKFATANVAVPEGGGYKLWLKKVGDNWTVLFGGQDAPTQELIDKYGLTGVFAQP